MNPVTFETIQKQVERLDKNIEKYADIILMDRFNYLLKGRQNEKKN